MRRLRKLCALMPNDSRKSTSVAGCFIYARTHRQIDETRSIHLSRCSPRLHFSADKNASAQFAPIMPSLLTVLWLSELVSVFWQTFEFKCLLFPLWYSPCISLILGLLFTEKEVRTGLVRWTTANRIVNLCKLPGNFPGYLSLVSQQERPMTA